MERPSLFSLAEAIKNCYLIPIYRANGTDWYQCPYCLNDLKIKGHAGLETCWENVDLKHDPQCIIQKLRDYEAEE